MTGPHPRTLRIVAALTDMAARGLTREQAAKEIRRTYRQTCLIIRRFGIPFRDGMDDLRTKTDALIEQLRVLAAAGHTRAHAAHATGRDIQTIYVLARRHGIEFVNARKTVDPKRDEMIAGGYRSGKSLQQVGDEFGVTRERVRQICARLGVDAADSRVARIRKTYPKVTCKECGKVKFLRPREKMCDPSCYTRRRLHFGEIIVRRRIAGEAWLDITPTFYPDKPRNSYESLARWARQYLEHVNAPDETWAIVFPGQGKKHSDLARERMREGRRRHREWKWRQALEAQGP
jgi:hypothetical protein